MIEVNKGVLVIGLSNTILFGGDTTTELLMLDVASGEDFSLPLSEEQVEYLLTQISLEGLLDIEEQPPTAAKAEAESDVVVSPTIDNVEQARSKLDDLLNNNSGADDAQYGIDARSSAEKTPQL